MQDDDRIRTDLEDTMDEYYDLRERLEEEGDPTPENEALLVIVKQHIEQLEQLRESVQLQINAVVGFLVLNLKEIPSNKSKEEDSFPATADVRFYTVPHNCEYIFERGGDSIWISLTPKMNVLVTCNDFKGNSGQIIYPLQEGIEQKLDDIDHISVSFFADHNEALSHFARCLMKL
jgi:hypothetical protein